MLSAKDLTLDMLSIDAEYRTILEKLPLEKVVLEVRQEIFPCKNFVKIISPKSYHYDNETREVLWQLGMVLKEEFKRLGLFRQDLSPLTITANIFAIIQLAEDNVKRWPRYYFESSKFMIRLIRQLDNNAYETWNGLDDDTIEQIKSLLKNNIPEPEHKLIKMRFGLDDGICVDRQTTVDYFGWNSESSARFHERRLKSLLGNILTDLKALAKLPSPSPRD